VRSGIVGEKDNLVTMHDILDAQWVYDNTKVSGALAHSKQEGGLPLVAGMNKEQRSVTDKHALSCTPASKEGCIRCTAAKMKTVVPSRMTVYQGLLA
jgi:hypothetical protein